MRRFLIILSLILLASAAAPSAYAQLGCSDDSDCGAGEICADIKTLPLGIQRGTCTQNVTGRSEGQSCALDSNCAAGLTCEKPSPISLGICKSAPAPESGGGAGTSDSQDGATVTGARAVKLTNPLNTASVPQLVSNIIKAFVGIVGAVALLIFVYGGFLWLTSAGEASKIQAGKDAMKWAVVGLAVVFSSYALVSFVLSALTKRVG